MEGLLDELIESTDQKLSWIECQQTVIANQAFYG